MTKPKAKASVDQEFETACSLWRMEFAFHTFEAVRAGIERFLERKLHGDEPEYYPMLVGLICLYARPFTNNRPVGPLPDILFRKNTASCIALFSKCGTNSSPTAMLQR